MKHALVINKTPSVDFVAVIAYQLLLKKYSKSKHPACPGSRLQWLFPLPQLLHLAPLLMQMLRLCRAEEEEEQGLQMRPKRVAGPAGCPAWGSHQCSERWYLSTQSNGHKEISAKTGGGSKGVFGSGTQRQQRRSHGGRERERGKGRRKGGMIQLSSLLLCKCDLRLLRPETLLIGRLV